MTFVRAWVLEWEAGGAARKEDVAVGGAVGKRPDDGVRGYGPDEEHAVRRPEDGEAVGPEAFGSAVSKEPRELPAQL